MRSSTQKGLGSTERAIVVSSAYLSAEALQSSMNLFVVDDDKETVHKQLISVAENCPPRLRV